MKSRESINHNPKQKETINDTQIQNNKNNNIQSTKNQYIKRLIHSKRKDKSKLQLSVINNSSLNKSNNFDVNNSFSN